MSQQDVCLFYFLTELNQNFDLSGDFIELLNAVVIFFNKKPKKRIQMSKIIQVNTGYLQQTQVLSAFLLTSMIGDTVVRIKLFDN